MKLIYIANARIPTEKAHGLQIIKMCEAFGRAGLEVELVVPNTNLIKEDVCDYYNTDKNFKVKRIFSIDFLKYRFFGRIAIYAQDVVFALSVFSYIAFNNKKYGNDAVLYFRDEFSPWLISPLNKKIFIEVHAFGKRFKYYKPFFKRISGLVVLTGNTKERFAALGFETEKIYVAPDGVDLEIFNLATDKEKARNKMSLPKDKIILGYTGKFKTMGLDKGIADIFKALKILGQNIIFAAAGGSARELLFYEKLADEMDVKEKVKLIGHVKQADLAVFQKACDALLMPFPFNEHYAYYMSPLKMFEYMASKRPIIASDLPSIRDVLNEDNAIIVKPDNPEDLARGIKEILNNNELAEKLAAQAFVGAQNYTWEKRAEKILEFIKNKNLKI